MSDEPKILIPCAVLTDDEVGRRSVFVTACMVLELADMATLIERGIIEDVGEWRRFQFNQLSWVRDHCALDGKGALRFDAFWRLVEQEHAALLGPSTPATPPA